MARTSGLSRPRPGCEELFPIQISCVTAWISASIAAGSLGFFSASSNNRSVSLSTRATTFSRSSSVLACRRAYSSPLNSLAIARYCSAGVAASDRRSSPATTGDRTNSTTKIPPSVRFIKASFR